MRALALARAQVFAPLPVLAPAERRKNLRFPMRETVRYRILTKGPIGPQISGQCVNMSSSGLLFDAREKLAMGQMVEVAVDWPAKLDGVCLLKLVAAGRVIRSEAARTVVRFDSYQFKTRRGV